MPRGHHQVSYFRVYEDTKNAIKRCMDSNASLSYVFFQTNKRKSDNLVRTTLSKTFERKGELETGL